MKKAIQFGAGNIGRGFIGKILSQNGYEVCFADVNKEVIEKLNQDNRYIVEVVGENRKEVEVKNVCGVMSNTDEILTKIAESDLITTAVGPNVLGIIARTLANGIVARMEAGNNSPLNIIACENMIKGSEKLKEEILKHIECSEALKFIEENVGFPNSAVDRIVPPMEKSDDVLKVRVEEFREWIVETSGFKGEVPAIEGMELTDNLMAFVERKLFTLNTGHAITAYLGILKGYRTIKESIEDTEIRETVTGAMNESGEVLINRYGFDRAQHGKYINKIISRFENPYLLDEVSRVGREPLRKLSFNDRLIKPLRGTIEYGTSNANLLKGVAAALAYRNEEDAQAVELKESIETLGLVEAFRKVSGLTEMNKIEEEVVANYNAIV